jgi:tRNA G26 N,N-dimethylase Trm1
LISSRAADVPLEMKIRRMLGRLSLEDTGIIGSYPVAKISQYCRRSPPGRERLLEGLRAIGINACEATFEENAIKTAADINQILGAF